MAREHEQPYRPEDILESGLHDVVAEKIRRAISSMLNEKMEHFVEQNVRKDDIEQAANSLFNSVTQGATEDAIERDLKSMSSQIATNALKGGRA